MFQEKPALEVRLDRHEAVLRELISYWSPPRKARLGAMLNVPEETSVGGGTGTAWATPDHRSESHREYKVDPPGYGKTWVDELLRNLEQTRQRLERAHQVQEEQAQANQDQATAITGLRAEKEELAQELIRLREGELVTQRRKIEALLRDERLNAEREAAAGNTIKDQAEELRRQDQVIVSLREELGVAQGPHAMAELTLHRRRLQDQAKALRLALAEAERERDEFQTLAEEAGEAQRDYDKQATDARGELNRLREQRNEIRRQNTYLVDQLAEARNVLALVWDGGYTEQAVIESTELHKRIQKVLGRD